MKPEIAQKKVQSILQIFDTHGGMTYFEVLGMLEHVKTLVIAHGSRMDQKINSKKLDIISREYEKLKRDKVRNISG